MDQILGAGHYDANGNEASNGAGMTFAYNAANMTSSITPSGGPALNMTYTGATQTERVTAGSTNFTYNELGCGGASAGVGGGTNYTRDNKGQLLEERLAGVPNYTPYYYLFDGLGSVVGLTDSAGNVVNTYSYEPYGKLMSSTGSVANPWLFAGGYFDSSTGLYKFGMRYYDAAVGRWTQEDPKPGPNLYLFVSDNPTNQVDPTGADSLNAFVQGCGEGIKGTLGMALLTLVVTGQAEITALDLGVSCFAGGVVAMAIESGVATQDAQAVGLLDKFSGWYGFFTDVYYAFR